MNEPEPALTLPEAAEYLGLTMAQIIYAHKTGHFPHERIKPGRGHAWLVPVSDLEQFRAIAALSWGERNKFARTRNQAGRRPCTRCGMLDELDADGHCRLCADELAGVRHWYQVEPIRAALPGEVSCHYTTP